MSCIGRYEIEREIGRGSMGIVYLARDPHVQRRVALKTFLLPQGLSSEQEREFSARFLREAQAAGALSHPAIVTIFDADTDPDRGNLPFIVMEYVEGGSLRDLMIHSHRLEPDRALEMIATLADALSVAHEEGIVHRDIKPANVLLRAKDGLAKIVDFGVARMSTSELTGAGDVFGSPAYMSPEQFRGATVDARSDLFSLATILYQILCGDRPFAGDDMSSLAYSVVHTPAPPIAARLIGNPKEVDVFFEKALAKDPAERFQDAAAFKSAVEQLRRALSQQTTIALEAEESGRMFRLPGPAGEFVAGWSQSARGVLQRLQGGSSPAGGDASGKETGPDEPSAAGALAAVEAAAAPLKADEPPHATASGIRPGIRPLEGVFAVVLLVLAVLPGIWALWSPHSPSASAEGPSLTAPDETKGEESATRRVFRPTPDVTREPKARLSRGATPGSATASSSTGGRTASQPGAPSPDSSGKSAAARTPSKTSKPLSDAARARAAWAPRGSPVPPQDESQTDGTLASLASPMSRDPLARSMDASRASGYLVIDARSLVKEGTIKFLVDGREVYQRRLSVEEGSTAQPKKLFRRREETFSVRIEVAPGRHTVSVQVFSEGKDSGREDSTDVDVQARESAHLHLVAGRILGSPVSIKAD